MLGRFTFVIVACAALACCGLAQTAPPRWKVDVVNGDRLLQISITTDRAGWAWLVRPGERMVLLDEPAPPREGLIELVEPQDCNLYDRVDLPRTSFTIVPNPVIGQERDFELRLVEGASIPAAKNVDFEAACSG
jgi:hypothetical protein